MNAELEAKVADTVKQADQLMVRFIIKETLHRYTDISVSNNLHLCCCILVSKEMNCVAEGT